MLFFHFLPVECHKTCVFVILVAGYWSAAEIAGVFSKTCKINFHLDFAGGLRAI